MLKVKYCFISCFFIVMLSIISPIQINAVTIKDKDFYDSYNTLLASYASEVIRSKLGPNRSYSLTDAKILKIQRQNEGEFNFKVTVRYRSFTNAHNPPEGIETITYQIDAGNVKVIKYQHKPL
ncbi:DUF3888 domain-containing protein [Priestia aryabhattai]|uniref:DUF3888 domain-containing protein n=1 Tax=Priestia megaterium TaxID=1404 RepID=UPI0039B9A059